MGCRHIIDRARDDAPTTLIHTLCHRRNRREPAHSRAQSRPRELWRDWRWSEAHVDACPTEKSLGKTGELFYQFLRTRSLTAAYCQALAAIGQGRLIALWDNLFGQLGQPIAQVLLTRGDISDVCPFW